MKLLGLAAKERLVRAGTAGAYPLLLAAAGVPKRARETITVTIPDSIEPWVVGDRISCATEDGTVEREGTVLSVDPLPSVVGTGVALRVELDPANG